MRITDLVLLLIFSALFLINFKTQTDKYFREKNLYHLAGCIQDEPYLIEGKQYLTVGSFTVENNLPGDYQTGDCIWVAGRLERRVIVYFYSHFRLISKEIKPINRYGEWENNAYLTNFSLLYIHQPIILLRQKLQNVFYSLFPSPQNRLFAGIVLGTRENFGSDFYNLLQLSGMLHLIAASGANLAIFAGSLIPFLTSIISRKKAIVLCYIAIWFYTVLSGLQPSIIRSAIMLSLIYAGTLAGRKSSGFRGLVIACLLMLALSPLLISNIGFWLSFSSSAGLILLSPIFSRLVAKIKLLNFGLFSFFDLKQSIIESTSAYLASFPLLLVVFGKTSLLSLIPNIFSAWMVPYIMVLGAFSGLTGLVSLSIARAISQPAWPLLSAIVFLVNIFGQIRILTISNTNILYLYAIVILLIYLDTYKRKRKYALAG